MHLEEKKIAERLHAAGWRFVDRDLPHTREDAERCHFYGVSDLIVPMDRSAHRAFLQALKGEPIDPPPSEWPANKIDPEVTFAEVSEQKWAS
jgi:hypothetical protein